jgi:hypothetical protein
MISFTLPYHNGMKLNTTAGETAENIQIHGD